MSFKNEKAGDPYAVHFKLASDTTLSGGSTVPYALVSGTTGHGLTVSSGVISLPAGQWVANFTLECTGSTLCTGDIYVDNVQQTDFPQIVGYATAGRTNMDSTSIPIKGPCDLKLVASAATYSEMSDLLIFGVK